MRIRDVLLKAAKAEDLQILFIQLRYCFYMNICLDNLVDIYIHIHTHTYIDRFWNVYLHLLFDQLCKES